MKLLCCQKEAPLKLDCDAPELLSVVVRGDILHVHLITFLMKAKGFKVLPWMSYGDLFKATQGFFLRQYTIVVCRSFHIVVFFLSHCITIGCYIFSL